MDELSKVMEHFAILPYKESEVQVVHDESGEMEGAGEGAGAGAEDV